MQRPALEDEQSLDSMMDELSCSVVSDDRASLIVAGIWIGCRAVARNAASHGFRSVVNCTSNLPDEHRLPCFRFTLWTPATSKRQCWNAHKHGLALLTLFVDTAPKPLLFHCRGGRHRAAATVVYILVKCYGFFRLDAERTVSIARPQAELHHARLQSFLTAALSHIDSDSD